MQDSYQTLAIKDIQTNPYQPRQHFEKEKLAELAQSIKENGIIQPLIVRKSAVVGYELMAGERRLRASQLAGLESVPVIIKQLSDQDMMTQAIIENLQRHDLSPMEEAKAYQNLVDKGSTHDMIAQAMGKSRSYISNTIRLLKLPKPVVEALDQETISQAHARTLLSLAKTDQQILWLEKIIKEGLSVRQLEQALSPKKSNKQDRQPNLFIKEQEKKLSRLLGTAVSISQQKVGQGQIKISFDSLDEFDRLIHKLGQDCD